MLETLAGYLIYAVASAGIGAGLTWLKGRKKSKALKVIVGAIEAAPPEVAAAAKAAVYQVASKWGVNTDIVDPVVQAVVDEINEEPNGLVKYTSRR